jgi:sugar phosphate isomerase/epimerase
MGARAFGLICLSALLLPGAGSDHRAWKVGSSIRFSRELSAERLLELKQAGIEAVELVLARVDTPEAAAEWRRRSSELRKQADSAGIQIWSVHIPFAKDLDISDSSEEQRRQAVRRISELIDAYAPLRMKKLVIHGSYEITNPIPAEERQLRIAASRGSLAELSRKARSIKGQLALECLPRACLGNTSAEIEVLIRGIDGIGVCLDTNHLLQEKTEEFARKLGSRIVTLHVSDYDGKDERHWIPGKGINNWAAIIRALEEAGYRGPFMFESAGAPAEKVAVWKELAAAAGR